jgi:alginate O-acetyltransferase complex protein AlgI
MLFNSFEFVLFFLPLVLTVYFILVKAGRDVVARYWLLIASLFFYSWWNAVYLPLILGSVTFNYFVGNAINGSANPVRRRWLTLGVTANLLLLGYFKYVDFFVENLNGLLESDLPAFNIVLPLAISFFTFQQIAYLVDSYRGETDGYSFLNYCLFVTFFPHLIAGPIVHHKSIIPQFVDRNNARFDSFNFSKGMYIFLMGLAKKVIIADSFAVLANSGYNKTASLSFMDGWLTSLSYSFQLYFDFSGYSDMTIGIALLFNIHIAINFNSPYKAVSIQDFWRRWHITLSNFLRDYLYIPLGGSRVGEFNTLRNLMITFVLGGVWHGAGWTFVFWGFLHGAALVIHRLWQKTGIRMSDWLGWLLTFVFVNFAWIFFRSETWTDAVNVLDAMIGIHGFTPGDSKVLTNFTLVPMLAIGFVVLFYKNPPELARDFATDRKHLWIMVGLAFLCLLFLNSTTANDFLYFDF